MNFIIFIHDVDLLTVTKLLYKHLSTTLNLFSCYVPPRKGSVLLGNCFNLKICSSYTQINRYINSITLISLWGRKRYRPPHATGNHWDLACMLFLTKHKQNTSPKLTRLLTPLYIAFMCKEQITLTKVRLLLHNSDHTY